MGEQVSEAAVSRILERIYDAALSPEAWPHVLEDLAGLFRCHFGDLFTRSHDRVHYRGLAFGLDTADYQEQFLDTWFKRNVWGLSRPVKEPGEVLTTREMVDTAVLVRTEIHADYLAPRDLNEGIRFALAADQDGIQDISLLRSWKAGPFEPDEIALAHRLLPHLQRASRIARRLHQAEAASEAGLLALERAGFAMILLDEAGRPCLLNPSAERILRDKDGLILQGTDLRGATAAATQRLRTAIARGIHADALSRSADTVRLPRPGGAPLIAVTIPFGHRQGWTTPAAPALVMLMQDPLAGRPSPDQLTDVFGLTEAEAELAAQLLAGHGLREIAAMRGRSIHTIRNHLARLMSKTETTRQSELVSLLRGVPPASSVTGRPLAGLQD